MEPDELFVPTRSTGPDDPDRHPAFAAQTPSAGARRYMAARSVFHPGRSSRPYLLSFERAAAQVAAPGRDGLLSGGGRGLCMGLGRTFHLDAGGAPLPGVEFLAVAGPGHVVRSACLFRRRILRLHGLWPGDR